MIDHQLPPGVAARQRPMPARPLHALWGRRDAPAVEWFIGAADVVHGTNFVVPPTRRAAAVVSVHDLTPLHYPELCNAATLAYPQLIRRALHRGAWVHADSEFVAAEVLDAFEADPDLVRAVSPGVPDLPAVDPAEADDTQRRLLPPGTGRYCLAVGTAEPRKDLPGLVRAFDAVAARHPDVSLVLAGPPGWGEEQLQAALDAARARARIVRTGWVEERDLAALLVRAAVLAFPSLYEGFGFPPLQAMRAGVPVVATRTGSLPEVLGDAALLVDPGDADDLAAGLDACLSDEGTREALIAAGTVRSARFSWERCGEGLETLYRDAAGATRG
ncbi:MAG TPA: glycosyltransferase family 1 protein [Acidimicrobiales bacterium]|jgi:glycosyltransferase involved in cell wall biosynthesis|nr:glycosyltransferase family 1 protein [Acidimicrobiales bacterium]